MGVRQACVRGCQSWRGEPGRAACDPKKNDNGYLPRGTLVDSPKTTWNFFSRLLIIGLGLLFVGLILVLAFGSVEGRQISPQTFQMRDYEYFRIPWSGIQITPVKYNRISNALVSFLTAEGYLAGHNEATRWDEVVYRGAGVPLRRGRAWVLAATLEMQTPDGDYGWLAWTEEHPEQAPILWRNVARAARDRVYFVIPDLMSAAKMAETNTVAMEVSMSAVMITAYDQQLAAARKAGEERRVTALSNTLESLEGSLSSH